MAIPAIEHWPAQTAPLSAAEFVRRKFYPKNTLKQGVFGKMSDEDVTIGDTETAESFTDSQKVNYYYSVVSTQASDTVQLVKEGAKRLARESPENPPILASAPQTKR